MVLDFPESVQRAWIGTAEYYTSTQAYLEKVVEHLKDLTPQDALGYYDRLSRMLRIFMTKLREKQGKKPARKYVEDDVSNEPAEDTERKRWQP